MRQKHQKFVNMKLLMSLFLQQLCLGFDLSKFSLARFYVKLVFLNFSEITLVVLLVVLSETTSL